MPEGAFAGSLGVISMYPTIPAQEVPKVICDEITALGVTFDDLDDEALLRALAALGIRPQGILRDRHGNIIDFWSSAS